jgi:hypothetical protein
MLVSKKFNRIAKQKVWQPKTSLLCERAQAGDVDWFEQLTERGYIDWTKVQRGTLWRSVIIGGNLKLFRFAKKYFGPIVKEEQCLENSARLGHYEVVKELLENEADPYANLMSAFNWACKTDRKDIVCLFLDLYVADLDDDDEEVPDYLPMMISLSRRDADERGFGQIVKILKVFEEEALGDAKEDKPLKREPFIHFICTD